MMKNEKLFIELYKEYETLLRNKGVEPKDIEDSSESLISGRLRICRQLRNYLSHQADSNFVSISDAQVDFLRERINHLKLEGDVLKKNLKTVNSGFLDEKDKCFDALDKFRKLKVNFMAVNTADGIKVATIFDVIEAATTSKTIKLKDIKLSKGLVYCEPLTPMTELPNTPVIICTSTGEKDGKILGVHYK